MVGFSGRKHAKSFIFFRAVKIARQWKGTVFQKTLHVKRAVFAETRNSVHCLGSFRRSFVQASGQHQPPSHPWGSVSPVKHVVMNVEDILKKVVTFKTEQLDKSLRPHPLTLQVNAEVEICIFIYNILSNKSSAWSSFMLCSSRCFTAKKKQIV